MRSEEYMQPAEMAHKKADELDYKKSERRRKGKLAIKVMGATAAIAALATPGVMKEAELRAAERAEEDSIHERVVDNIPSENVMDFEANDGRGAVTIETEQRGAAPEQRDPVNIVEGVDL